MILVVNAGSSSIKIELFDRGLNSVLTGAVTEIGGHGALVLGGSRQDVDVPDHAAALDLLLTGLEMAGHAVQGLDAAAHRVVHGGADLVAPCRITEATLAAIEAACPLAPLHNPHNLAAIRALAARVPALPQFASFDTAFHATVDPVDARYALPPEAEALGLRRYGFHGLSYASIVARLGAELPPRLLAFHLGNGASLCAIRDGRSVATSMGYSPLDGLTMGTRSGAIDGMAVLRLAEVHGIDGAGRLLNRESGLKGLARTNDMAELLARDDAEARFAVAHFCHWAARHAGSALVALGGCDGIVFTGGIGENAAPVREAIVAKLSPIVGEVPVQVMQADEERQIARDARALLENGP